MAVYPDPAALADRMPGSLPSIGEFHARIGVAEEETLAAGATHRIGIRFDDWAADGQPFVHAFGDHGRPIAPGAFHQHWLNARRSGRAAPFDAYSPAAALARAPTAPTRIASSGRTPRQEARLMTRRSAETSRGRRRAQSFRRRRGGGAQ